MSETLTCQSEYGKLKTVFLKHPAAAFRSQELIDQQWKPHNYLSRPNFEKAIEEYKIFEKKADQQVNVLGTFVKWWQTHSNNI